MYRAAQSWARPAAPARLAQALALPFASGLKLILQKTIGNIIKEEGEALHQDKRKGENGKHSRKKPRNVHKQRESLADNLEAPNPPT